MQEHNINAKHVGTRIFMSSPLNNDQSSIEGFLFTPADSKYVIHKKYCSEKVLQCTPALTIFMYFTIIRLDKVLQLYML